MDDLTTEQRMEVIHNWTRRLDISLDRTSAKIVFAGRPYDTYKYVFTLDSFDDMIEDSYEIVNNRIWDIIDGRRF